MTELTNDPEHDDIARRAHDIANREGGGGTDIENWLQAEQELAAEREPAKPAPRARKPKAKPAEKS